MSRGIPNNRLLRAYSLGVPKSGRVVVCDLLDYSEEWNWQSQQCVRALIADVGGTASDERFWIVNTIAAELSWQQIQTVAMHPHVESIGSTERGSTALQPQP